MSSSAQSLVQSVYADLRQKLQFSEIGPQDRLVDVDISATYGISRMPAREALLRLAAEGYLVSTTRGFMLPTLSHEDVLDLFELRRALEPRAAASAARDLSPEAERQLGDALAAIRAADNADDLRGMVRGNVAFRSAWTGCIRNRQLAATIARFMDYFQAIRLETFADRATRRIYRDGLEALCTALLDRDPLGASDRMTAFLFAAEAAYCAALARMDERERTPLSRTRTRSKVRT